MIVYPTNQGSPLDVFTSLYEIARRDTQLGEEPVANAIALSQIFYTAPTDLVGFGRPLIAKLTSSSAIVYVMAVGGDFTLDDGTPISEVFGITIPDGVILLGDEELPAIVIYYDYTNGNGEGYALFDENGEEICLPSFVLLGHELSHASHMIDGDHPEDMAEAHENLIIPEENLIREEHGLPLRDPANDGGVTPSELCAAPEAGGSSSCFVLTAALGMERRDPIAALHALRRRLLGPTRFGALFYAAFRREYYSFAPTLADDIRSDSGLRRAVRQAVIEPFLAWAAAVARYLTPCAAGAPRRATHELKDPTAVAAGLGRLAERLRGAAGHPDSERPNLDELTDFLGARIGSACGAAPYTAWAVFEPARLWLSDVGDADDAVENWLGAIPIPERFFQLTPHALAREFEAAFRHGLFSGVAGGVLASRIGEAFRQRGREEPDEWLTERVGNAEGGRSWRS